MNPHVGKKPKKVFKKILNLDSMDEEELFRRLTGEKPSSQDDLSYLDENANKDREERAELTNSERMKAYPAKAQAEMDLHHRTGEEAGRAIRFFVSDSQRQGLRKVRMITGKGLHSENGHSIVKEVTEQMLSRLKGEGSVFAFRWENGSRSTSGAMIVYLP